MLTIENWEVIIEEDGVEKIALPFSGSIVKGEIENNKVKILMKDINFSKLTAMDKEDKEYLLSNPRKSYIESLTSLIEYAKEKGIYNLKNDVDREAYER